MREPPRWISVVSTPMPLKKLMHASPIALTGSMVMKAASSPNCASETATLASPPPKVASKEGDCSRHP